MDAYGRNTRRITSGDDHNPAWSPDGERIAFDRYAQPLAPSSRHDIWVVKADGTGEVPLTSAFSNATYEEPAGLQMAAGSLCPSCRETIKHCSW